LGSSAADLYFTAELARHRALAGGLWWIGHSAVDSGAKETYPVHRSCARNPDNLALVRRIRCRLVRAGVLYIKREIDGPLRSADPDDGFYFVTEPALLVRFWGVCDLADVVLESVCVVLIEPLLADIWELNGTNRMPSFPGFQSHRYVRVLSIGTSRQDQDQERR